MDADPRSMDTKSSSMDTDPRSKDIKARSLDTESRLSDTKSEPRLLDTKLRLMDIEPRLTHTSKLQPARDLDQWECRYYRKLFQFKFGLVLNMCVHTGEKQYVCRKCEKAYSHSNNLIQAAHGEEKQ